MTGPAAPADPSPTEPVAADPGRPAPDPEHETWDVVVVGGGVAGLVTARDLAVGGLRPLVVEAWTSPGGVVGRHELDGLTLDAGAESFATRGGVVAELAADLGLADRVTTPEPRGAWVRLPHGSGPLPRTGLLGIPAQTGTADVRRTLGRWGALRAGLDRVLPASVGVRPEGEVTTLGGLVRARMGRRALDRLVRPVVAGVHAAEPDDVAVEVVAPGLLAAVRRTGSLAGAVASVRALAPAGAAVGGFEGGLHVLVDALTAEIEQHGGTVRCRTRVVGVDAGARTFAIRVEHDPRRPGVSLGEQRPVPEQTGSAVLHAHRLVVATPRAVDLLAGVVPGLDGLHTDPGADIVLATLVLDAPELDAAPRGTGVLVAREVPGVRAKALTHATAKWGWLARAAGPGRHVVRLSYGRAGDAGRRGTDLAARPAELPVDLAGLTALALADASAILGVELRAEQVRASARVSWSQSLPVPSAEHRRTVQRVRAAVAPVPGLAVTGAWVAGNGLASVVPDARATAAALLAEATLSTSGTR